jgi:DNA-binding NarL/FixJ family response regulator/tetratricopeptide (TPR) repeat protein
VLRADGDGFTFTHPIVRSTWAADPGPAERRRIHRALAARLLAVRRAGGAVDLAELAAHIAASADPGDREAIDVLAEAARSMAVSAPVFATRLFATAADLLAPDDPQRATLRAAQARAAFLAARYEEAGEAALAALDALGVVDDPATERLRSRLAEVVIISLNFRARFEEAMGHVDRMLATLPPPQAVLLAHRARILTHLDRFSEAAEDVASALDAAATDGERALGLGVQAAIAYSTGDGPSCRRLLEQQQDLSREVSATSRLATATTQVSYLAMMGDVHEAEKALAQAQEVSALLGGAALRPTIEVAAMLVDWQAGRWTEALARSRWLGMAGRTGSYEADVLLGHGVALLLHVDRGDLARAKQIGDAIDDFPPAAWAFLTVCRARLRRATGDVAGAVSVLEDGLARAERVGRTSATALLLASLADAERLLGHDDRAHAATQRLIVFARRSRSPIAEVLAARSRAVGSADVAAARRSVEVAGVHGLVVEEARGRLVLGTLGVDRAPNLRAAYDTFVAIGSEADRRHAAAALRAANLDVPRRHGPRSEQLSDGEIDLARYVHEGLTNRQIAQVLHLSPKTIETYLTRLYARVGVSSRLELALAYAEGKIC